MVGSESNEIWRPVVGYEGVYSVSENGVIRREIPRPRTVAQSKNRTGYMIAMIRWRGRTKCVQVHRLVAAAFIGPCPSGHQVNHKDGQKHNNQAGNLEYVLREMQGASPPTVAAKMAKPRRFNAKTQPRIVVRPTMSIA